MTKDRIDKVLTQYQSLVLQFACAIIQHPDYPFNPQDKRKYFDDMTQTFQPNWKYDLTILEAQKFADALIAMDD